nr:bacillithiol system redox-active protein YtxJ [Mesobacillus harenae]
MEQIQSVEQFDTLLQKKEQFFLLKHSNTCPISQAGYDEFNEFANARPEIDCYYLVVQEARPVSNHIAETFHVKHESPQTILFVKQGVAWHASHWKITNNNMADALAENQ